MVQELVAESQLHPPFEAGNLGKVPKPRHGEELASLPSISFGTGDLAPTKTTPKMPFLKWHFHLDPNWGMGTRALNSE
jgi:hypothetical protein